MSFEHGLVLPIISPLRPLMVGRECCGNETDAAMKTSP